ncbi:spermatogenesis-defective protein 39 homolog isoform X1 [Diorhabda carinulata]|uniref:spermatogenesis-defective protein 39 homolog isoform X1 n=1 Tax=Diorhabda carinulata TaxID=1163345 RepID=UPI0025A08362|nr:spermatogenesis-defective protein 39 homolog isoform X1 [Diorhabda carinulata]
MSAKNSEDFWNTSSSSGFNFDEEEEQSQPDYVFTTIPEENSFISIHSLISKNSLDLILGDIKSTNEYVVPPVEEVIRKMFIGQTYSLEVYKKYSDKILLLESALDLMDGNVILNVILFLKSTLKQNLFFQLVKKKVALKHYVHHLIVNNGYQELADLYMAIGQSYDFKQLYYLIGRDIKNKDILFKRLQAFITEHMQKVYNLDDRIELDANTQFLRYQIEVKETCNSAIEQLASLCKKEWSRSKNAIDIIMEYKMRLNIDNFAFEWTVMNVLASMKMWPQLSDFFIKPNWLKKNSLKTVIPAETFVWGLSRHDPPKDVLEQYLPHIPDSDRSLYLAEKFNCHKFVIQSYVNQKDRLALISYKSKVSPQNAEYFLIENALQAVDKKWKN